MILDVHNVLMENQLFPHQRGMFRSCDVRVGSNICLPHQQVAQKMQDWVINVNNSMKYPRTSHENAKLSRRWHIQFMRIQPFVSGNGTMGRLLFQWFRLMVGLPVLVIYETRKNEYMEWFAVRDIKNGTIK